MIVTQPPHPRTMVMTINNRWDKELLPKEQTFYSPSSGFRAPCI